MGKLGPRRERLLTDEQIVERYRVGGVGIRTLVTESGYSYGTIHRKLSVAGVLRAPHVHAPNTVLTRRERS